VLQDLEAKDMADSLNVLYKNQINVQAQRITVSDMVIANQQAQIENLKEINITNETILITKDDEIKHWKKQYRKQKRQKIVVGVVGLAVVALSIIGN
jgi:hypothetical protein